MNLKSYMVLCVTCFLNWAVTAYRTVQTIAKKFPKEFQSTNVNFIRSISGMFSSFKRAPDSSSALNMIAVSLHPMRL